MSDIAIVLCVLYFFYSITHSWSDKPKNETLKNIYMELKRIADALDKKQ